MTCVLNGQRGLNFTGEPTQCDQIKRLKRQLICALKCVIMLQHKYMQRPENQIRSLLVVLSRAFTQLGHTWCSIMVLPFSKMVQYYGFFLFQKWAGYVIRVNRLLQVQKKKNLINTQQHPLPTPRYEKHGGAVSTQM